MSDLVSVITNILDIRLYLPINGPGKPILRREILTIHNYMLPRLGKLLKFQSELIVRLLEPREIN